MKAFLADHSGFLKRNCAYRSRKRGRENALHVIVLFNRLRSNNERSRIGAWETRRSHRWENPGFLTLSVSVSSSSSSSAHDDKKDADEMEKKRQAACAILQEACLKKSAAPEDVQRALEFLENMLKSNDVASSKRLFAPSFSS